MWCIQFNERRSKKTSSFLSEKVNELRAYREPDILLLQEPNLTREDVPKDFPAYCDELQGNAGRYICALLLNNKYDRRLIRIRDDENQCPGLIAGVTVTLSKKDIHFFRYIEGLLLPLIPC